MAPTTSGSSTSRRPSIRRIASGRRRAFVRAEVALVGARAACATDAAAAPQSLARISEFASFALAGDAALLARTPGRVVKVDRLPLTAGAPRTTVFRRRSAGDGASASIGASDTLAAIAVLSADRTTGRLIGEEFAGPPLGPLTALGPPRPLRGRRFAALYHVVDGNRLFTTEFSFGSPSFRWVVREPGAEPRTLPLPDRVKLSEAAGDLIASGTANSVIVENWRTGAEVARHAVPDVVWLDVRADGALVTADRDGNVVERLPGAAPRVLSRRGAGPAFAGDRVVFIGRIRPGVVQLQVADPDGRVRPFGVPSADLKEFTADAQRVLWRGNGCLLTAPITEPPAAAPDAGACARTEVYLPDEYSPRVKRDRRLRVRVDCVAAAPPGCRGTLSLRPRLAKAAAIPDSRRPAHAPDGSADAARLRGIGAPRRCRQRPHGHGRPRRPPQRAVAPLLRERGLSQPKKTRAVSYSRGSSSFGSASASSSGTRTMSVPRSATILPKSPSVAASIASTPKRVPSTRS